jgi:hypothetical protein
MERNNNGVSTICCYSEHFPLGGNHCGGNPRKGMLGPLHACLSLFQSWMAGQVGTSPVRDVQGAGLKRATGVHPVALGSGVCLRGAMAHYASRAARISQVGAGDLAEPITLLYSSDGDVNVVAGPGKLSSKHALSIALSLTTTRRKRYRRSAVPGTSPYTIQWLPM